MLKTQALLLESVSSMRLWRTLQLSRLEVWWIYELLSFQ